MGWLAAVAMLAATQGDRPVKVEQKTPAYTFSYAYPRAATQIAPLRRWLEADRAAFRARTATLAKTDRNDRRTADFPFHAHDAMREWKVVTQTPRLLSLSGVTYRFTGGAHGNTNTSALLWDRAHARRVDPRRLFVSADAVQRVFGATWCAWLKAERRRRLEGSGPVDDGMFPCPPVAELTLLMGSTDGRAIDRIGLVADQYVAGSYAEGIYEATVPVTPDVLRAVKPAWRAAFALGR